MKIIDANLLLHAVNRDSPMHAGVKAWFEKAVAGDEPFGLAWIVILAFMRSVTSPRVVARPLRSAVALEIVDELLAHPNVRTVLPGRNHWATLKELLSDLGTAANLTHDAYLAALAVEQGARLYSLDPDFSRFRGLRWVNPIDPAKRSTPGRLGSRAE